MQQVPVMMVPAAAAAVPMAPPGIGGQGAPVTPARRPCSPIEQEVIDAVPRQVMRHAQVIDSVKRQDRCTTVFIEGLPFSWTEGKIVRTLCTFDGLFHVGNALVTGVRFMYADERPRGIAYINLVSRGMAEAFLDYWDGKKPDGRHRLAVQMSETLMPRTVRGGNVYGAQRIDEKVWEFPPALGRQTED